MKSINGKLFIKFDTLHNKEIDLGGTTIIRPDMWKTTEKEDGTSQFESNVNKLQTHPQVATVKRDSQMFKKGTKVFLHYLAKEWEEVVEVEGEHLSMVQDSQVLFTINEPLFSYKKGKIIIQDAKFNLVKGVFLGTWILDEAPKTDTGIFLTSSDEQIKNDLKIVITHIPNECKKEYEHISIGDVVVPMDKNNYVINYQNVEYVVLKDYEIAGVLC